MFKQYILAFVIGFFLFFQGVAHADLSGASPFLRGLSLSMEKGTVYSSLSGVKGLNPDHDGYFSSQGSLRLGFPLGETFGTQMDVAWTFSDVAITGDGHTTDLFSHSFQMAQHLFYRHASLGSLGAFGGFGQARANGGESGGGYWFSGGEGYGFWQDMAIGGQVGYLGNLSQSEGVMAPSPALFLRGVGRYFLSPNQRLQAELAHVTDLSKASDTGLSLLEFGARYDRVLEEVPLLGRVPLFVGYRGTHVDLKRQADTGFWEHAFYFGMRYAFGGETLQEIERDGASKDLPDLGRWFALGAL